jgi:hypothetical protein
MLFRMGTKASKIKIPATEVTGREVSMNSEELTKWHQELDRLKAENPTLDDRQLLDAFITFNSDALSREGAFTRQPKAQEAFETWKKERGY